MTEVSRRDAFKSVAKAGAVVAGLTQLATTAHATGRHSDPDYCNPICFVRGTLVDLRRGATPIEDVKIGDEIRTHRGDWTPVKWVGHMSFSRADDASWRHGQKPVVFRRNSISDNVPSRDLYVSQQHAMLVDDVFVPAKYLVNGTSIAFADPNASALEYFQIECEQHEAIFAHGAACETFFATELRPRFANHAEYIALYGADENRAMTPYRPILRHSSLASKVVALAVACIAALGFQVTDPVQRARDQFRRRARNIASDTREHGLAMAARRALT
jgi:hypothetical protein